MLAFLVFWKLAKKQFPGILKLHMTHLKAFYNRYHKKNNAFFKVITKNNFTYFYLLEFLRENSIVMRNKTILDVGCGVGTLSLFFAQARARAVVGLDISDRAIAIAQQAKESLGYRTVIFRNAELTNEVGEFDIILCSEVIEHITDDLAFLKIIRKNLKNTGVLILTTPSLDNRLYKLGYYKKFDAEVGHLRRYTQESITQLLKQSGFVILNIRSVEGPLRNILFTSRLGFLIRFIRGPFVPVFHFLDRVSAKLFGASDIQVVAQKIRGW